MIRILLLLPSPGDGTSFYRAMGVFESLRKTYPEIHYEVMLSQDLLDWSTVTQFDLFFMQRPFANVHIANAVLIKKMRKPYIVDYDDHLFAIPKENLFHHIYNDEQNRKNMIYLINNANSVWVSTRFLKEEFIRITGVFSGRVAVIPNAFNDLLFDMHAAEFSKQPMSIMWRGGDTHFEDLKFYAEEIERVVNETKVPITFYGSDPKGIINCPYTHEPFRNIIDYFEMLRTRRHQVMIVPLVDSPFNRAKSNCSWMEGTYGGSAVLAPNEWKEPGLRVYHSAKNFGIQLGALIGRSKTILEVNWSLSKDYIIEHLLLSDVNDLRAQIIEKLVE